MSRNYSKITTRAIHKELGYTCSFCDKMIYEKHHIEEYHKNKDNSVSNFLLLCPNCHTLFHFAKNLFDSQTQLIIRNEKENMNLLLFEHQRIFRTNDFTLSFEYFRSENILAYLTKLGWYNELSYILDAYSNTDFKDRVLQKLFYLYNAESKMWLGSFIEAFYNLSLIESINEFTAAEKTKFWDLKGRIITYLVSKGIRKDLSFQNALECHYLALEYNTDKHMNGRINSNIISVQNQAYKLDEALDLCKSSIDNSRSLTDSYSLASNLDRFGSLLNRYGLYEKGLIALKESLILTKVNNHKRGLAYRCRNISRSLLGLKEYKKAWTALKLAKHFSSYFNDINRKLMVKLEDDIINAVKKSKYDEEKLGYEINTNWKNLVRQLPLS